MAAFTNEAVLSVRHWTDTLFSFTATRSPSLRFESGQFVMMGLEIDGRPLTSRIQRRQRRLRRFP